jgi:cobalt/nickel transport system ATP-binding protein
MVSRGESIAILGPNGCGKSTLLKLINGIVLPDTGSYHFDGDHISRTRLGDKTFAKHFHQRVAFLFQSPDVQLFCPTVSEEVAFGPRQMGLAEEEIRSRVEDCMELLGIAHLGERAHYHLSEGEKRKVALASILSLNPEVLVLDEPLSGLDPRTKRFLRELIISLHRAGKTIVCATHDFRYMEGVFQRAAVFSEQHSIACVRPYEEAMSDSELLRNNNLL